MASWRWVESLRPVMGELVSGDGCASWNGMPGLGLQECWLLCRLCGCMCLIGGMWAAAAC